MSNYKRSSTNLPGVQPNMVLFWLAGPSWSQTSKSRASYESLQKAYYDNLQSALKGLSASSMAPSEEDKVINDEKHIHSNIKQKEVCFNRLLRPNIKHPLSTLHAKCGPPHLFKLRMGLPHFKPFIASGKFSKISFQDPGSKRSA